MLGSPRTFCSGKLDCGGGGNTALVIPTQVLNIQGGPKNGPFLKCITLLYNDIERRSKYQNVQLFIGSKNDILNAGVLKYSLHKIRETTLY